MNKFEPIIESIMVEHSGKIIFKENESVLGFGCGVGK